MNTLFVLLQAVDGPTIAKAAIVIAASLIVLAAGLSISRIGVTAVKSIARQPEASGDIRTNMIVSAALIEGVSFFALILCIIALFI